MSQVQDGRGQDGRHEVITWVGEQRLMTGYCGRAPAPSNEKSVAGHAAQGKRPAAVVRSRARQSKVVRIGPPKIAGAAEAAAEKAVAARRAA